MIFPYLIQEMEHEAIGILDRYLGLCTEIRLANVLDIGDRRMRRRISQKWHHGIVNSSAVIVIYELRV